MSLLTTADQPQVTQAIQKVSQISTLPEVTAKIIQIVEDPRSTAKDLEKIIKHDVALSAKILKVVNSAFYGLPRQVGSVERAIVLLGLSTVKNIAVATSITKLFASHDSRSGLSAKSLWRHSLACGVFCKMLAQLKRVENSDEIFVAGLMHDIGILVEKQVYPQKFAEAFEQARSTDTDLWEAELDVLGADHQAFGTALAGKWKFPDLFQLSTGYHHQPLKTSEQHLHIACAVHLADALTGEKQVGLCTREAQYSEGVMDVLKITEDELAQLLDAFDEQFITAESVMA